MNRERMLEVLLAPHMTEKTALLGESSNQVVFRVARSANKLEIKHAVEQLFEVKVESVRTAVVKGKTKMFGRIQGRRSTWKKAYVRLQEGQDINFIDIE